MCQSRRDRDTRANATECVRRDRDTRANATECVSRSLREGTGTRGQMRPNVSVGRSELRRMATAHAYCHDRPIRRRKHGYILMTHVAQVARLPPSQSKSNYTPSLEPIDIASEGSGLSLTKLTQICPRAVRTPTQEETQM
eukprot:396129-Prorocentrum_minimum.AAC.5